MLGLIGQSHHTGAPSYVGKNLTVIMCEPFHDLDT
jgi:hypothetical protein